MFSFQLRLACREFVGKLLSCFLQLFFSSNRNLLSLLFQDHKTFHVEEPRRTQEMFLDGTSLPENHQNYNDKRIKNLGEPVEDTDATTKGFINNQLRKRTFHVTPEGAQGHLKMNNYKISGLANPAKRNDATHKHYVDSHDEYLQDNQPHKPG